MNFSLEPTPRIGIFGHCGNTNLGDEATIAAVIQNVRKRAPNAVLLGFTLNPEGTEKQHGIPSFPIRRRSTPNGASQQYETFLASTGEPGHRGAFLRTLKYCLNLMPPVYRYVQSMRNTMPSFLRSWQEPSFLMECYKNLQRVDLLIIAGSHQLNDYVEGPWSSLYTLLKWVLLSKLTGTRVVFLSVGAGPIRSRLGRLFAKKAIGLADYCSFRDQGSSQCIQGLGVKGEHLVTPDLVYSLRFKIKQFEWNLPPSRPVVGINAVPFVNPDYWLGASAQKYQAYVTTLAEFALWLIHKGYVVWFYPTQLHLDPGVINDVRTAMSRLGPKDVQYAPDMPIHSFEELISAISMMDFAVPTRFHGIILPFLLKKPVLGIAYHPKTIDLMAQMGQSQYAIDIHQFQLQELQTRFLALERAAPAVKQELDERLFRFRLALDEQYDHLATFLKDKVA